MYAFDIIDLNQNSQQWLDWRRGKIGASDAPAIMGVSKFKTPLQLWEEHVYGKSQETTFAMQKGKEDEIIARLQFNLESSSFYDPTCIQSKKHPWMIASLDGWDAAPKGGMPRILEIKSPGVEDHRTAITGKIPDHYYPQLQHQMMVSEEARAIYFSFRDGMGVKIIVEKNEEYCQSLLKKEEEFYEMLNSFKAPEATDRDIVEVKDDTALILARSYRAVQSKLDDLLKEKEEIKEALIKSAGHPRANIGGVKVRRDLMRGRVDYDKIEVLKEIDLEQYRKPSQMIWKVFS